MKLTMKIIFKQKSSKELNSSLSFFGIDKCYLKECILGSGEYRQYSREHHHTFFEVHIIASGYYVYRINGEEIKVFQNDFLFISPDVSHTFISASADASKYVVIFEKSDTAIGGWFCGKATQRMLDNIILAKSEESKGLLSSHILAENAAFEIIISLLRSVGYAEKELYLGDEDNHIISIAKQYIKDNAELNPTVNEVASYCRLSAKQLTRLFIRYAQISPGEYIKNKRTERVKALLDDNTLTLKEISDKMNFSSEYYFNTFVKRNLGLPPGEYRRCFIK